MCGTGTLAHRPYLYYLTPSIDLNVAMCVEECPPTTGSPISIYEADGVNNTAFNYTRIQCDRIGKYCYPAEPSPRKTIDTHLSDILKLFRSVIGELFQVDSFDADDRRHGAQFAHNQLHVLRSVVRSSEESDHQTRGLGSGDAHCCLA
jgi:hypothetical protein